MTKEKNINHIDPKLQRKYAKMGRMASGAGKTIRATRNAREKKYISG